MSDKNIKILKFVQDNHVALILTVITILGAALRLKGLTFNSYWVLPDAPSRWSLAPQE